MTSPLAFEHFVLWFPPFAASAAAAVAWIVTAASLCPGAGGRHSWLQTVSALLGCAHAVGAGRSLFGAVGLVPMDATAALSQTVTALVCASVAVCLTVSRGSIGGICPVRPIPTERSGRDAL